MGAGDTKHFIDTSYNSKVNPLPANHDNNSFKTVLLAD